MSHSVTSRPDSNESTVSLTTNPNDSTVALIPKSSRSSSSSAQQTTTTTTSTSATTGVATTRAPVVKDWEKAYAELATSIGFSGGAPQLPPRKKKTKNSDNSKKFKEGTTTPSTAGPRNTDNDKTQEDKGKSKGTKA